MRDLFFDKATHTYYYKGEKVPCVSDILAMVDVVMLKGIPQRNLEIAAERGTRVHEATEDLEYGLLDIDDEKWLEENADIQPYLIAYSNFLKTYPSYSVAREESLYNENWGFAGTLDIVKSINGRLSIIDIKTSKTISGLRSMYQLTAYLLLWNGTHPNELIEIGDLYILQLKDNGEYRLIQVGGDYYRFNDLCVIYKDAKGDEKL